MGPVHFLDYRAIRTSNDLHLRNAMTIPQHDADLGGGSALLCELADLVHNLFRRGFEPGWGCARVWYGACRDTFAVGVEATHLCGLAMGLVDVLDENEVVKLDFR